MEIINGLILMLFIAGFINHIRLLYRVSMLEKMILSEKLKNLPVAQSSDRTEGEVQENAIPEKHSPENYVPKSSPSNPKTLIELLKEDNPKSIVDLIKEEYEKEK